MFWDLKMWCQKNQFYFAAKYQILVFISVFQKEASRCDDWSHVPSQFIPGQRMLPEAGWRSEAAGGPGHRRVWTCSQTSALKSLSRSLLPCWGSWQPSLWKTMFVVTLRAALIKKITADQTCKQPATSFTFCPANKSENATENLVRFTVSLK